MRVKYNDSRSVKGLTAMVESVAYLGFLSGFAAGCFVGWSLSPLVAVWRGR